MHAEQAADACEMCMLTAKSHLMFVMSLMCGDTSSLEAAHLHLLKVVALSTACHAFAKALRMVVLDSELLDIPKEVEDSAGYRIELKGRRLVDYQNDDHCADETRFTRDQITTTIDFVELPECIRVCYNYMAARPMHYKFHREELFIYMLRRFVSGKTNKDVCNGDEFGGDDHRWSRGCTWMVDKVDETLCPLISPQALRAWAPHFPYFANQHWEHMVREKERSNPRTGEHEIITMGPDWMEQGQFNAMSITDCTVYEICRPGSGPETDARGAPRKPGWHCKQRSVFDGYHRGFEACLKVLTIFLPNGLTAAVCGPTSGRKEDKSVFRMAEFDEFLTEVNQQHHGGFMHCAYGDGIFGGYWNCLRSCHREARGGLTLSPQQHEENQNMKGIREAIEWSYGRAESLFRLLNYKDHFKLEVNHDRVLQEIRAMFLLANLKTCCCEGNTCTGMRQTQCPPPTLEECLEMINDI